MGWWVGGFDRGLTAVRGNTKVEALGQFYKTCTSVRKLQVWLKLKLNLIAKLVNFTCKSFIKLADGHERRANVKR